MDINYHITARSSEFSQLYGMGLAFRGKKLVKFTFNYLGPDPLLRQRMYRFVGLSNSILVQGQGV